VIQRHFEQQLQAVRGEKRTQISPPHSGQPLGNDISSGLSGEFSIEDMPIQ
jgi:hypothetical protein